MKDYMKPTLQIALAAVNGGVTGTCTIIGEERDLLLEVFVGEGNVKNAFASTEACAMQFDIDGYCRFTSTELGAAQVFGS